MQNYYNYKHTLFMKIEGTVCGLFHCWENGRFIGVVSMVIPEEYDKLKQEREKERQCQH